MASRASASDVLADSAANSLVSIAVVLLVVLIWLLIQVVRQVCEAFARCPRHRGLWSALLGCLGCWGFTGMGLALHLSPTFLQLLFILAIGSTGFLYLVAWVVARNADVLLQPAPTTLVTQVLHRPWWH